MPEIGEARDAVARIGDPARYDAGEVRKLRRDVERDAVQAHPVAQADTNRGDLVFMSVPLVGAAHPDADALVAPLARDVECRECADDPFLEARDVAAHVRRAA